MPANDFLSVLIWLRWFFVCVKGDLFPAKLKHQMRSEVFRQ